MVKNKFELTKDSLDRIKTISTISKISFLQRNIVIRDEKTSVILITSLKDIPDDFSMPIYDLNNFLVTCQVFDRFEIIYDDLEEKGYIKIVNADKNKEYFYYRKTDESFAKFNMGEDIKDKVLSKKNGNNNIFKIKSEDIKKLLNAIKIISSNVIKFYVEGNKIKAKTYDIKVNNCNIFEMEFDDCEVNFEELYFLLDVESFSKLEKGNNYNVYITKKNNDNKSTLIIFENESEDLCMAFSNYNE